MVKNPESWFSKERKGGEKAGGRRDRERKERERSKKKRKKKGRKGKLEAQGQILAQMTS